MKTKKEKQNKILKSRTKKLKWNKSGSPPRKLSNTITFLLFMRKAVLSKCTIYMLTVHSCSVKWITEISLETA